MTSATDGRGGAPVISVVIPVRNGRAHLSRCLSRLDDTLGPQSAVEVIVVDNGSSDGSAELARGHGARVLDRPGLRVGACRNAGAAAARADILAFIDADNEIGPSWMRACAAAFQSNDVGAAGYPYDAPAGGTWVQRMFDALRAKTPGRQDVEWLGAGNLAIRRDVFDRIGGFDANLEACEDVDLCRAVREAGFRIVSDPAMASAHYGDPRRLSDLFYGELWRGRDNLRVSLRGPLTARSLPGVLLPFVGLGLLVLLSAGLIVWPWTGPAPSLVAAAGLTAMASVRAFVIISRGKLRNPVAWAQSLAVAATYELARALALVMRATHRTRARIPREA